MCLLSSMNTDICGDLLVSESEGVLKYRDLPQTVLNVVQCRMIPMLGCVDRATAASGTLR